MLRRLWVSALPEAGGCCGLCDFTRWKEHDAYQKAFDRLLRDLWVEKAWPRQGRQKPVQRLFCSGAGCSDPGANRVF
jgi:hypothetical protein